MNIIPEYAERFSPLNSHSSEVVMDGSGDDEVSKGLDHLAQGYQAFEPCCDDVTVLQDSADASNVGPLCPTSSQWL